MYGGLDIVKMAPAPGAAGNHGNLEHILQEVIINHQPCPQRLVTKINTEYHRDIVCIPGSCIHAQHLF